MIPTDRRSAGGSTTVVQTGRNVPSRNSRRCPRTELSDQRIATCTSSPPGREPPTVEREEDPWPIARVGDSRVELGRDRGSIGKETGQPGVDRPEEEIVPGRRLDLQRRRRARGMRREIDEKSPFRRQVFSRDREFGVQPHELALRHRHQQLCLERLDERDRPAVSPWLYPDGRRSRERRVAPRRRRWIPRARWCTAGCEEHDRHQEPEGRTAPRPWRSGRGCVQKALLAESG